MSERTHGMCGNCHRDFELEVTHVAYGGLLWCSEDCLTDFVSKFDRDINQVKSDMVIRNEGET